MEAIVAIAIVLIVYIIYRKFKVANDSFYAPEVNYEQVIENYIGHFYSLLKPYQKKCNLAKEIAPFAYVVGRISVEVTGGNVEKFNIAFDKFATAAFTNDPLGFETRFETYIGVANGMPYRADWSLTNVPPSTKNDGILRCAIVLGDYIANPACREDYFDAPVLVDSIFKDAEFFEFFIRVFFPQVQKYSYAIAGKQFKATVQSFAD